MTHERLETPPITVETIVCDAILEVMESLRITQDRLGSSEDYNPNISLADDLCFDGDEIADLLDLICEKLCLREGIILVGDNLTVGSLVSQFKKAIGVQVSP